MYQVITCDKLSFSILKNGDEKIDTLRAVSGGHTSDIVIVRVDWHLGLITTGSREGDIAIYDYELSNFVAVLVRHTHEITEIVFMSPKPIMISSCHGGLLCVWTLRPVPEALRHICLISILNMSPVP